jgi:hypothetical protein
MTMIQKKFNQILSFQGMRVRSLSMSVFCVLLPIFLTACASAPNASFTMQDGVQILVYSLRRSEIKDYGFGSYWGHWGSCSPHSGHFTNRCSPFGIAGDLEIRERNCQVGYWIKDGKVTNIMGENSAGGLGLCGQLLNRCLKPIEEANQKSSSSQAEDKADKPSY